MSRARRFTTGLGVGYFGLAIAAVCGLWVTRFLLDELGSYEYGLWLVAVQALGYLSLLDLGIQDILPREIATATGKSKGLEGGYDITAVVSQMSAIAIAQLPLVAAVSLLVVFLLPEQWETFRRPAVLVAGGFTLTFPFRIFHAALKGLQDLGYASAMVTLGWIAGAVTTVVLVAAGYGLSGVAVGWVTNQATVATGSWVRLRVRFPEALPRASMISVDGALGKVRRSLWASVSQVAHTLHNGSDVLMIGAVLGPAAAVPYVITGKLITLLRNLPSAAGLAVQPVLSELRAGERPPRVHQAATAVTEGMLIFSGMLSCMVLGVNKGFVEWWVGDEHWGGLVLTVVILLRVVVGHWSLTHNMLLFAYGYDRRRGLTDLLAGVLSVVVSIPLIARFGIIGAPLGWFVGTLAVKVPANLVTLAHESELLLRGLLGAQWHWSWRFVLSAAVAVALALVWTPVQILTIGATAAGLAAIYEFLMVPRLLSEPLAQYLHPALTELLSRTPRWLRTEKPST